MHVCQCVGVVDTYIEYSKLLSHLLGFFTVFVCRSIWVGKVWIIH